MELKKANINIEEFDSKSFQVQVFEPEGSAFVTHYLHNFKNGIKTFYEKNALKSLKSLVEYKQKIENNIIVTEEAMQLLLFEVENVPFPRPEKYDFKFIDLFAGIGGFRLALQNKNGRCIFTSEFEPNAKKTYRKNFGQTPFGDITTDFVKNNIPNNEEIDILCAGFPCQAFSIAGYQRGFDDTRGNLFFDIEKIAKKHKPKVLFLENVKNLVSHDNGNTFRTIVDILEKRLKYKVFHRVLNSMTHADIPQNRERIFIIAFDPKQVENYSNFRFPSEFPLTKTIHNILEKGKQEKFFIKLVA